MATNVTYMLGIDAGASAGFAGAGWVWPYPVADRHSCAPGLAVGYVPQRLAVSHTLPLSLRRLMKLTAPFPAREIDAALAAVGLDRLGDPPVTSLSGGELQRLLLAGALIHRPDLLVLDEPAQGVDIAGAGVLHELIEGIRSDLGCGILLISHDLQMVMNSDSVVVVLLRHEHDDPPFGAAAAAQSAEHRERTGAGCSDAGRLSLPRAAGRRRTPWSPAPPAASSSGVTCLTSARPSPTRRCSASCSPWSCRSTSWSVSSCARAW